MNRSDLPSAFAARMESMLGGEAEAFFMSFEREEIRGLRFNTRKRSRRAELDSRVVIALGAGDPASCVPWAGNAWYYPPQSRPGKAVWHDVGLYYIQEPSAMSAAELLAPEPGERVLDLCAAPGGKTTQLACLLGEDGLLVANEIHPARARILSQNVERMGIDNCLVANETPERLAERFPSYFHRILVDAPCSGEGMFHRTPEALVEWSPEAVELCAARQDHILDHAIRMLRPGGTLVYSTCTFAPQEDEGTVSRFLARHPDCSLEPVDTPWFDGGEPAWGDGSRALAGCARLWPHHLRGEGHFAARIRREESAAAGRERAAGRGRSTGGPDPGARRMAAAWLRENLSREAAERLSDGEWICYGDQLYLLPEGAPAPDRLKVLRPGLHLGSLSGNRFEPSHALGLWLRPEEALRCADISAQSGLAESWLRGDTLREEGESGWTLVCVDGLSAGFGKRSGGQIKNHVPRGLRRR